MTEPKENKVDWFDRLSKIAGPIIGGLLIAVIAFQGDQIITNYTSRQENARLITELQIQREQAESDLRKDVFDQAIAALLSEEELQSGDKLSLSKRLMKLELLAHNFGSSLNLSPLFVEFNRDLEDLKLGNLTLEDEARNHGLQRRLRSLARRLASEQLSALAQHGMVFEIKATLEPGGNAYTISPQEYSWPYHAAIEPFRSLNLDDPGIREAFESEIAKLGNLTFDGVTRQYKVVLDDLDPSDQEVSVTLEICWDQACAQEDPQIYRPFTLDYFNFPKIDNTRLSGNQRFAMVLEEFRTKGDNPELVLAAVVFPSEHSSLRDRPSMGEAVDLLNSVLKSQSREDEDEDEADDHPGGNSDAD